MLGEVGLLGDVLGAHDLGDEALVVAADVAEADNFALVAEGLGGSFGRTDGDCRFHARDLRRSRGEAPSLQLRLLRLDCRDTRGKSQKAETTGKTNGEAHGDSLKNTATCGLWPKSYWLSGLLSTAAAAAGGFSGAFPPVRERAFRAYSLSGNSSTTLSK